MTDEEITNEQTEQTETEEISEELIYYWGIGRRKTSVARVRICSGTGFVIVNGKRYNNYFCNDHERAAIIAPLKAVERINKYNVICKVGGGGKKSQADAISLGISRALKLAEPTLTTILRDNNFLTRDPRMKERKKYGRRGARRGFQFSKR